MLMDVLFNSKIWSILLTLILLFTIVNGLRYMGMYEGLENSGPAEPVQTSKQQQLTTVYNF